MKKIWIYDTTLRDGAQSEEIEFSLEDKLLIAQQLDSLGVPYIEGGYPAPSNTKDLAFYEKLRKNPLKKATLVAFGSTRRAKLKVAEDPSVKALLQTQAPAIAVVGKTWDLHVRDVLRTTLEQNLSMIEDTIQYLKKKKREVLFDAEHYFDAFQANPEYAGKVIQAASRGGADWIVLCDTNGGTMPDKIAEITRSTQAMTQIRIGIHTHNDTELAVANALAAVSSGAVMVQGTTNGYGERCGNANLSTLIPNLQIKYGYHVLQPAKLKHLTSTARFVAEIANVPPREYSPYVGINAFAHKGGLHVDAVRKNPVSYEHVAPETVGNVRRIIISEQAGVASVLFKAEQMGITLEPHSEEAKVIINKIKELEALGYKFEGADASFRLLVEKHLKSRREFFKLEWFRVSTEKREGKVVSEATIKLSVNNTLMHTAAEGDGPVNALDNALRKALEPAYPGLKTMHLVDFKVRVLESKTGTAARVRVFVESRDEKSLWGTVGVSTNMIEASWEALIDAIEYKLQCDRNWR